ncbi:FAD-dependent oxidoreductase [Paenibacillus rhizoplanae]
MKPKAVIIGAGFGGLSCAVTLAAEGWDVTVLERQQQPGGKLQRVQAGGLHLRPWPKYDYDAPCLPLAL